MKFLLAAALCIAAVGSVQAQTNGDEDSPKVSKTTLARKESDGTITEDPETFRPKDVPIICYVDLTVDHPVEVRLVSVAKRAVGLRPESRIATVTYKTKQGESGVTFTSRPKGLWAAGSYRADVFLNGTLSDSKDFTVVSRE